MALKRFVNGKWVEVAGPSTGGSNKAVNVSITDSQKFYDSSNVEGALAEIGYDVKDIKKQLKNHTTHHPGGSGGGGGGGSVLPTITSDFEITTSDGESPITIPIYFTSPNLGEGTLYILVNNIERGTQQIQQGNNDIIVPALGAGKNIPIVLYVKDRAGMLSNQLKWVVTAGGIKMTMITDTNAIYNVKNRIMLSYTIDCMSTEDIYAYFDINGVENQVKSINGYNSYELKDIQIGIHRITYWAESGDYVTEKKKFVLLVVDENTLIVYADFDSEKEYESGVPISIPYRVAIDRDEDFTVNMYVNDRLEKTITTRPGSLYWTITSLDPGSYTLKIEATSDDGKISGSTEFACKVIQGEYTRIQPVMDASLLCWFDATDRTNDDADRDTWTDKFRGNKGTLHNFNYGSNGWIKPEGSEMAELVMDGTCYVEIDMTPFRDNFKNGGAIEIVFKARDVGNDAARILDITDVLTPFKGVYIDTREAYIASANQTINASIGEDEYIQVIYNIDRTNKYAHVVVNGVITKSCKLSDSGTGTSAILESFAHTEKIYLNSKKGIEDFGSCEVKHFRIYDRALSFDEILQNYLSTIEDIALQKKKSDFNDPLKNIMPIMNITCDPEVFATMTDTNKVEVAITYTSPNSDLYGQTLTTATKSLMYWQGTSSIAYDIKNFNIILRDDNRQEIMYSPYPNCIPQSLFCLKANLMESTNAHNVGLADYVRKYLYIHNNPAQDIDPRASRTIQGFPILLYINGKLQGVYDFNLDRYSTTAFGYNLPAHKDTCRVYEISANTNSTAGAFIPWSSDKDVTEWAWYKNDFMGIYPPEIQNANNDDFAALKNLISFVHDTSDRVFEIEFDTYFDKESVIRYYILVMVLGLVDSLGKNAKLVTYDGVKWYFEFYDMDTAFGLDNTGALKYDVDIEVDPEHFNTADSVLWTRVRTLFYADIETEYYKMRNQDLTLDKIYECLFTNQIEKIPEKQYNLSTQSKYLKSGEYIMMSNGNRYYNLKRWIKERLIYCDTLFNYSPTTASYITVRSGVEGSVYLDIETYYPMYITIEWRNQADGSGRLMKKVGRNKTVRFEGVVQAKDQEVLIYGAKHLKTVSGMEGIMPRHLLLNSATKLTSVECPNNTELINVQMEKCSYLQRINLSGCSSLGVLNTSQVLDVSGCNNLRYLNASGTVITSININQSGGNLVELYTPKTLQKLELRNQYSLRVVGLPASSSLDGTKLYDLKQSASNMSSFTLINCPLVERLTASEDFGVGGNFFDNYTNERRASDINYLDYPEGEWKRLMSWGNGLANCYSIHIENSCYNVPSMSFRGISNIQQLTLRNLPGLKTLMLGANCCGYRYNNEPQYEADTYDTVAEFDWDALEIIKCDNIEEFRIHEMYPYNWNEGAGGNLTYFTFKPGTESINLAEKFPKLKIFECNLATQNIHQIILPRTLESIMTCAWNKRHDEGFKNEVLIEKFNIDSIYFDGEHDTSYEGIDLGGHKLKNVCIVAPYAKELLGVDIVNEYTNPIFNDFKEPNSETRPFITPNGVIDVSGFKWKYIADWFAFVDFTNGICEVKTPEDWTAFLKNITRASRMFYYCTNPEFTWEFAMQFFPKLNTYEDLSYMYQHATLAEQESYETSNVIMENKYNIGGYNYNANPFRGANLKYVKEFTLTACDGAYATFAGCESLIKIGDCRFTGNRSSTWGIDYLCNGCINLEEVGSITSSATRESGKTIPMENAFEGCYKLRRVGALNFSTNNMNCAYYNCLALENEGLSFPYMGECTDIRNVLYNCKSLTQVNFETLAKVIYADGFLRSCESLTSVHLPDIGRDHPLQEIGSGFSGCKSLETITIGGETLPIGLRNMSYLYSQCELLTNVIPIPNDFMYDVDMSGCCSRCSSLTDDTIYKEIPFRVTNVSYMYERCNGLINPVVNINTDNVYAKQTFRYCENIKTLTVNFNGRLLRDSTYFAEYCNRLETINFKFPSALMMHDYYGTGVTYYNMFQYCNSLKVVNLNMAKLADTNSKADFGCMFYEDKYIEEIHGLDFTYLKKPVRSLTSTGQNPYDWHDTSITYGAVFENLNTFDVTGALIHSYDFKNINTTAHTKTILRHLDTVTEETLGLTYNIMDAIDDEKTENVDEELRTLALSAMNDKGWTFAIV